MLPQPVAQRMGGEQLLGLRKTAPPFIDTEERGQPFLDDREPDILGQGPRISIVSTTDGTRPCRLLKARRADGTHHPAVALPSASMS